MDKATIVRMLREATHEPYQLGIYFQVTAIPPIDAYCTSVDAGPVRFVIESRELTDDIFEPADETGDGAFFEEAGASLHVYGTADGLEHLRFDCFENKPHYHYMQHDRGGILSCRIDQYAEGDPIAWTLGRVRGRLPEMLDVAGATELATQVRARRDEVIAPLDRVAELMEEARVGAAARAAAH